jgi:hypothetical protein
MVEPCKGQRLPPSFIHTQTLLFFLLTELIWAHIDENQFSFPLGQQIAHEIHIICIASRAKNREVVWKKYRKKIYSKVATMFIKTNLYYILTKTS